MDAHDTRAAHSLGIRVREEVVAIGSEELARYIGQSTGESFPITFVLNSESGTLRRGTIALGPNKCEH